MSKSTAPVRQEKSLRSESLNLLRFPLALVILIIHVFGINGAGEVHFTDFSWYRATSNFINAFMRGQSVPIYFFISGYVFFLGIQLTKEKLKQKLNNRRKTLLVPYLIWNSVSVLLILAAVLFLPVNMASQSVSPEISLSSILSCYWMYDGRLAGSVIDDCTMPIDFPLWFLRDLMLVVLCTPILNKILKKKGVYWVIAFGILWFATACGIGLQFYFPTAGLFFFSWGAYMSINQKDMLVEFGRFTVASVILYLGLGMTYMFFTGGNPMLLKVIKSCNVIVGLLFAYNLSAWLLRRKWCKVSSFLASASFFIYVTHGILCGKVYRAVFYVFKPDGNLTIILSLVTAVVLTTVLLLAAFYLLRQYAPNVLKIVAGRK